MTSFEKCKAALGSYRVARKFEEKLLLRSLHLTDNGRLDIKRYRSLGASLDELSRLPDFPCVIVFSDMSVPPIKCRFKRALSCLNDVLAVSAGVWILNESRAGVIEIYRGAVTMCDPR